MLRSYSATRGSARPWRSTPTQATRSSATRSPGYMACSMRLRTDPVATDRSYKRVLWRSWGMMFVLVELRVPGGAKGSRTPDVLHAMQLERPACQDLSGFYLRN